MSEAFHYVARASTGRSENGRLDAANRTEALARLRARGLTPLSLRPTLAIAQNTRFNDNAARDLSRSLAQLLHSGLSLAQALKFAADELAGPAGAVATKIRESVERGERPSDALHGDPSAQARLLRGVLIAGEASGRLAEALDVAALAFGRSAELNGRVMTALIYPTFVLAATATTLGVFVLFVTPALGQAFEGAADHLPLSTRILLSVSAWLREHGLLLLGGTAVVSVIGALTPQVRAAFAHAVDRAAHSPLGLGIAARLDFATFSRLTGLALSAGVPTAVAFGAGAAGLRSPSLRADLDKAIAAIRVGERPSRAIEQHCQAPATLLKLIQVGEETGKLAQSLEYATELIAGEAEQRLARIGAIAGPVIMLALGGIVGSVVLSLFLGLMSLSDMSALQ